MRILSKIGACLLIAALSTVARAQSVPPNARMPLSQATLDAFLDVLTANRRSALFSGPPVPCTIGVACNVKLKPQELFDASNKLVACAMQVGEIKIEVGASPTVDKKTEIHWTIDPPAAHTPPTNATYTFELGSGLIVFKDNDNATAKKADSVTATELIMTHKFKKHDVKVI